MQRGIILKCKLITNWSFLNRSAEIIDYKSIYRLIENELENFKSRSTINVNNIRDAISKIKKDILITRETQFNYMDRKPKFSSSKQLTNDDSLNQFNKSVKRWNEFYPKLSSQIDKIEYYL